MSTYACAFRSVCADQTVCGECVHAQRCEVCGATEGLERCDWPEWRFVTARYSVLQPGDWVRRAIERLKNRPAAMVESVERTESGDLRVVLKIRGREKSIVVKPGSPVQVEREAACKAVVCELHRAERGPGATVCMSHWRSWEAAA